MGAGLVLLHPQLLELDVVVTVFLVTAMSVTDSVTEAGELVVGEIRSPVAGGGVIELNFGRGWGDWLLWTA